MGHKQGHPPPYLLAIAQSQLTERQGRRRNNLQPKEAALPLDLLLYKRDNSLQPKPGETRGSVTCSRDTSNQLGWPS